MNWVNFTVLCFKAFPYKVSSWVLDWGGQFKRTLRGNKEFI